MSEREYKDGYLNPRELEYIDKIDYYLNNLRINNLRCLQRVYEGKYDFAYHRGERMYDQETEILNDVYYLLLYTRALRDKLSE